MGDFLEYYQVLRSVLRRQPHRLRYACTQNSTVIWVRVIERADSRPPIGSTNILARFPEGGYGNLRARVVSKTGTEMILTSTGRSQYLKRTAATGGHVEGWLLNGSLEDHRGSVLHIESPDGFAITTLHVR